MKILVSDFDYTFFSLDYLENIKTVQNFVNKDNIFMIATGRSLAQILEEVRTLYVPYFFLICDDGAMICDRQNNVLFSKEIEKQIVEPIFRKLDKSKHISEVYIDNASEYTVATEDTAYKIIAKPKDYNKANKLLQTIIEEYPMVQGYISETWLNIMDHTVSKGNAIEHLLERFHLNSNDVSVVGDNINDISMFEKYKGYAMDTADDLVKAKCLGTVKTLPELIQIIEQES